MKYLNTQEVVLVLAVCLLLAVQNLCDNFFQSQCCLSISHHQADYPARSMFLLGTVCWYNNCRLQLGCSWPRRKASQQELSLDLQPPLLQILNILDQAVPEICFGFQLPSLLLLLLFPLLHFKCLTSLLLLLLVPGERVFIEEKRRSPKWPLSAAYSILHGLCATG